MRGFILKLKGYNSFKTSKKSVTFAGALVFFTLLGLVPTVYLFSLTLSVFGKELSSFGGFFITEEFTAVKNFVFEATEKIGASGSAVLGFISVYSATSVFVHLRYIGEVIYDTKKSSTLLIRILSLIGAILLSLVISFLAVIYAFLSPKFRAVLGGFGGIINTFIIFIIVFIVIVLLNSFACPYKIKFKSIIKGSMISCILSIVFTIVFLIYLKYFASYDKIYGSVAVIPVFLAWLFIVMRSLVTGMLINAYNDRKRVK